MLPPSISDAIRMIKAGPIVMIKYHIGGQKSKICALKKLKTPHFRGSERAGVRLFILMLDLRG